MKNTISEMKSTLEGINRVDESVTQRMKYQRTPNQNINKKKESQKMKIV